MNALSSKSPSETETRYPTTRLMYRGHVSVPSEQIAPVDDTKRVLAAITSSARNTVIGSTITTCLSQSIVPSGNTVRNHIIGGTSTQPEHTTHVFFCCFPADWFSWLRVISTNRATVPSSAQPNESHDGGTACQHQQGMSRFEEEMIDMEAHRQR
ncbi:hypothetical protein FRC16_000608 [Serendipita sp. 398]|nr:hypothetical protein FRC16_000608 [Serendipita sp. 398]